MTDLAGKACVVTGASKGLGRAFCEALIAEGAVVAMVARDSAHLREAASTLGDAALAVPCDVSDPASVNAAFDKLARHFGRVDVLVSNAATMVISRVEEVSDAQVARQLNVNVAGAIFCARAAIPYLRVAGGGDIVFIGSESAKTAFPYLSMYAATKAAIEGLAAGLREELRDQRTRVTAVRLGRTEGSSLRAANDPQVVEKFVGALHDGGYLASHTGEAVSRTTMTQMLIALLKLPSDVNVDLIVPRGRSVPINI
ncbi:short-chain dehydrogenase [Sphingobium sp. SCG-1]|uniref:SDR family oxidoreductase n=1 Tax=Sphingobium sp. SCG-1 TaxID=2072936 RepID=UPI000CD6A497|nr:SDR family oxidoreductase [Sphingobium sp. SCG-1]AUW57154.1 short-chain dehydrogenase [Sphingobium sp. SCG-1]